MSSDEGRLVIDENLESSPVPAMNMNSFFSKYQALKKHRDEERLKSSNIEPTETFETSDLTKSESVDPTETEMPTKTEKLTDAEILKLNTETLVADHAFEIEVVGKNSEVMTTNHNADDIEATTVLNENLKITNGTNLSTITDNLKLNCNVIEELLITDRNSAIANCNISNANSNNFYLNDVRRSTRCSKKKSPDRKSLEKKSSHQKSSKRKSSKQINNNDIVDRSSEEVIPTKDKSSSKSSSRKKKGKKDKKNNKNDSINTVNKENTDKHNTSGKVKKGKVKKIKSKEKSTKHKSSDISSSKTNASKSITNSDLSSNEKSEISPSSKSDKTTDLGSGNCKSAIDPLRISNENKNGCDILENNILNENTTTNKIAIETNETVKVLVT